MPSRSHADRIFLYSFYYHFRITMKTACPKWQPWIRSGPCVTLHGIPERYTLCCMLVYLVRAESGRNTCGKALDKGKIIASTQSRATLAMMIATARMAGPDHGCFRCNPNRRMTNDSFPIDTIQVQCARKPMAPTHEHIRTRIALLRRDSLNLEP